jgi:hypothetical protein
VKAYVKAPKRVLGRLKECVVDMGTFPFRVHVVMGPHSDLARYMAWRHDDDCPPLPAETSGGCCWPSRPDYGPVIWLSCKPNGPRGCSILSHEAVHAVGDMMRALHMDFLRSTEEVACYAVCHIVETVMEEFGK